MNERTPEPGPEHQHLNRNGTRMITSSGTAAACGWCSSNGATRGVAAARPSPAEPQPWAEADIPVATHEPWEAPAEPPVADLRAALDGALNAERSVNGDGVVRLTVKEARDIRAALRAPALVASSPEPRHQFTVEIEIRRNHRVVHRPGIHGDESWCDEDNVMQPCDTQVVLGLLDAVSGLALKAGTPERPLDAERIEVAIRHLGSFDGRHAGPHHRAELIVNADKELRGLTSDTQPPAEPGEVER